MNASDVKCYWSDGLVKDALLVKDRVKLLAMVTHQHFTVSDSHALLAQHVVERCPAEM
jgi:hypothetical protein